jgi:MFS family permease
MTISTRSRAPVNPARLCAFNFGIQFVWGAILAVSLQGRASDLSGGDAARAYALIAAIGAACATVAQLAFGALSDRRRRQVGHRREFYLSGIALAIPALGWFYLAPSSAQLLGAFCLLQLAMNVALGAYQAAIPDYVAVERRGTASSWLSGYQSLGNAAGLLLAGFVHDLRIVASALALGLGGSLAVAWTQLVAPARAAEAPAVHVKPGRALAVLLLSRGLINVGFFTLLGFLLFFVRDSLGVAEPAVRTQSALLFLSFTLAAIAGAAIAARPTDRYDKRLVVTIACLVIAGALAALATAHSLPIAYGAALLAGAAWGAFVGADWALAAVVLPPGSIAGTFAVWNVATTVPQILAPIAALPLVERFNARAAGLGPRAAIVVSLLEFVAGGALIWLLPRL